MTLPLNSNKNIVQGFLIYNVFAESLQDKVVICKRQIILICAGTVATTYILPFHSLWNFNDSFAYSIVICYFLIKCNSKKYCKCQSNQCNTYRCDKDRFVAFFMCHTTGSQAGNHHTVMRQCIQTIACNCSYTV